MQDLRLAELESASYKVSKSFKCTWKFQKHCSMINARGVKELKKKCLGSLEVREPISDLEIREGFLGSVGFGMPLEADFQREAGKALCSLLQEQHKPRRDLTWWWVQRKADGLL